MADILVVDDDESVAGALRRFLESEGHRARISSNVADALASAAEARPDLVMMDIRMPGVDGMTGLDRLQTSLPGLCVVIMTGYGTSQTSIDAMRAGAFDYLTKPPDLDALRRLIHRALASREVGDVHGPPAEIRPHLVGEAPAMVEIYKMIGRLATNDMPALVVGEHGTGKSLAIAQLHDSGARAGEPLVRVDCSLPVGELDVALFGSEPAGTLHLAHLESLPAPLQSRLARALGDLTRFADRARARVIGSTTADLAAAAGAGQFSRDLYRLISVITLQIPPLRERRDDLPLLVRHFLARINAKLNRSIRGLDAAALDRLRRHAWPGNVGELERVLTRAALVAGGDVITSDDVAFLTNAVFQAGNAALLDLDRAARAALQARLVDSPAGGSIFHDLVDDLSAALVKEALAITKGNQVKASELLGLNRTTLRKKAPAE